MKKLAIAQIVLGILVVGSLIYWMGWLSTGYHIREGTIPGSDTVIHSMGLVAPNPLLDAWTVVYLMLGLSVFGCGIAQFVKARHKTTSKAGELESSDESKVVKV